MIPVESETQPTYPSPKGKFYYGWVIVGVSFATLIVVFGIRLSFAVFFVALIDDFGWSRADTSFIFSTNMIVFAGTSTLAGVALDRYGARWTFGVGIGVLALGLVLSSLTQVFWHLVVAYGVIAGLGITILGLGPQASLIARWFVKRRGAAIGIAFAGTGLGTLVLTPGLEFLISSVGWRIAYLLLAGLTLVGLPFNLLFLRLNPKDKGIFPDGAHAGAKVASSNEGRLGWRINQAIRVPSFWLLILASFGAIGPVRMLTVHQLAAITDVGFSSSFAAGIVGASGAVTSFVFILSGALSDKIGRRVTYALGSISLLIAILILGGLSSTNQTSWLLAYVVLLGFGEGSRSSLVTAFASDLFPGEHVGAINGAVGAAFGLGAAIFPWMAGLVYDSRGDYSLALRIAMGLVIISAIALWVAPVIHRNNNTLQID